MKLPTGVERSYIRYSPFMIIIANLINGLLFLNEIYDYYYLIATLAGCSFLFTPQFIINHRRYSLCNFYLFTVVVVNLNLILALIQYFVSIETQIYLYQVIIVNSVGATTYLIKSFCKHTF